VFRAGFARCPLDGTPLQQIVDDPLTGSVFADRYVIEQIIGEGAMGRVYRARHRRMSRKFAIKVLFGDHATDPKMRERFGREAEAASRLSHANVISVMDFGETEEGLLYLAMEYVEGKELADIIDAEAPMAPDRIRRMVRQLCAGLDHAHGLGLVHRDFKAANVIVAGSGDAEVCKIVDFGIAVLQEAGGSSRLTTEGIVLGTPAYMSPEQATGQDVDARTDLFALGVLIYEMLSGVMPFEGPPVAVARQNLAVEPPRINQRVPGLKVDPELEALSRKLMAKRREQRPQSAAAVIETLDAMAVPVRGAAVPSAPVPASSSSPVSAPHAIGATGDPAEVELAYSGTERVAADDAPAADDAAERPRRAGLFIALLVALLVLAGGGYLLMRGRGGGEKHAAGPPTAEVDAGLVARVPVDATSATPADAATVAVAEQVDAGRSPRHPPRDAGTRPLPARIDAGTARPPPPADAAPKPAVVTQQDLQALYVAVGAAVDKLERVKGAATARPFRDTYMSIPFSDALRTPSLRREVDAALRKLRADVNREMK
jgi:serine/threonine-protein kinase